jgi:hypothetical protein
VLPLPFNLSPLLKITFSFLSSLFLRWFCCKFVAHLNWNLFGTKLTLLLWDHAICRLHLHTLWDLHQFVQPILLFMMHNSVRGKCTT